MIAMPGNAQEIASGNGELSRRTEDQALSLQHVSVEVGLPKTTVFRYLRTLVQSGLLSYDPERDVYGVGLTLRCSLEALKASRGHLLLTGSAAGRFVIPGSMYSASKWAVTGMGLSVREELRGTGVRVTLIEPGMVDTPLFDQPPPYALQPDDIARAVVDRKSTRLNSSHMSESRMPSSA